MVVHNPNNWYQKANSRHWVDRNCLPWTKEYLGNNVVDTTYEDDALKLVVTEITTVSGDCDVTQRKGKTLCIYDMKLRFAVSGSKKDEEDSSFTGTIALDEFFHDQDDDEYVFVVEGDDTAHIKKHLVPLVKAKLVKFQGDLIGAHEKDVQHSSGH
ncbi:hypothetical protein CXQ85_000737 [Candidozyma haemuli]|uniref:Activator of Hsp90 ATPase AHSA1-like N-terminal domain-containing protein n=1 Tax=Candidozyma haemuli TaxID=45357 RepID=A0A2V1AUD2_9ASCO|nr:hypothetical protein CXQ85_000737 [[Candida] haemuloni]PVH21747.1 hypothetical protein CXQ85_000737 [[Candida] haemuloni]